mmetsp:Transcript_36603/g.105257  ORF Transcript_36603/g.105257 Transcript_36603/m.105257 type:complete len:393 (-) Transcript_36603:894-2072(-)
MRLLVAGLPCLRGRPGLVDSQIPWALPSLGGHAPGTQQRRGRRSRPQRGRHIGLGRRFVATRRRVGVGEVVEARRREGSGLDELLQTRQGVLDAFHHAHDVVLQHEGANASAATEDPDDVVEHLIDGEAGAVVGVAHHLQEVAVGDISPDAERSENLLHRPDAQGPRHLLLADVAVLIDVQGGQHLSHHLSELMVLDGPTGQVVSRLRGVRESLLDDKAHHQVQHEETHDHSNCHEVQSPKWVVSRERVDPHVDVPLACDERRMQVHAPEDPLAQDIEHGRVVGGVLLKGRRQQARGDEHDEQEKETHVDHSPQPGSHNLHQPGKLLEGPKGPQQAKHAQQAQGSQGGHSSELTVTQQEWQDPSVHRPKQRNKKVERPPTIAEIPVARCADP